MAASLGLAGNLSAILKEFYLGPVQEQLNNEMLVLQTMEKSTVDWNGRVAILPVHLDRNVGVGFRAEGGTLPVAGQQDYDRLQVHAAFLYGRFQITGPAMSSAGKGGANSFIGWVDAEMNKLVTDVKNLADEEMISGGRVLGYINEHEDKAANPRTYEFFGNIEKLETFRAAVLAVAGNEILISITRMDTYAPVAVGLTVTSTDVAARTFTLENIAGNDVDLTVLPAGVACAIMIDATQATAAEEAVTDVLGNEPVGVFGNLGLASHFGVDRTTATGAAALQSNCLTMSVAGLHPRADIGLTRIQGVLDEVLVNSGKEPNVILMNPVQRQKYAALFQLTASVVSQQVSGEKATNLNGGFTGLAYGNLPIKTSRHVPNGGLIFMSTPSWKLLELEGHAFADIDGDVLLRVANQDSYEGYYRWYYNTVTTNPNQNAILAGLTLV